MAEEIFADIGGTHVRLYRGPITRLRRIFQAKRTSRPLPIQLKQGLKRIKPPFHLTVGMRGVWTPSERRRWKKALSRLAVYVEVESDVELAHYFAFGDKPGILLISGTGSICLGKKNGRMARAGGLGPTLGDEGSAFWIGREYVKRSGRYSSTQFRGWGKDLDGVRRLASRAPQVLKSKNSISKQIQSEAIGHLTDLVVEIQKKLHWKGRVPVHLTGGVFSQRSFRLVLEKKLKGKGFRVV